MEPYSDPQKFFLLLTTHLLPIFTTYYSLVLQVVIRISSKVVKDM